MGHYYGVFPVQSLRTSNLHHGIGGAIGGRRYDGEELGDVSKLIYACYMVYTMLLDIRLDSGGDHPGR